MVFTGQSDKFARLRFVRLPAVPARGQGLRCQGDTEVPAHRSESAGTLPAVVLHLRRQQSAWYLRPLQRRPPCRGAAGTQPHPRLVTGHPSP